MTTDDEKFTAQVARARTTAAEIERTEALRRVVKLEALLREARTASVRAGEQWSRAARATVAKAEAGQQRAEDLLRRLCRALRGDWGDVSHLSAVVGCVLAAERHLPPTAVEGSSVEEEGT